MLRLFIHGHSLAEYDEHFLKLIERGKIDHVFVGIHGDPESAGSKQIIRRANKFADNRGVKRPLKVEFYDSKTASVWAA